MPVTYDEYKAAAGHDNEVGFDYPIANTRPPKSSLVQYPIYIKTASGSMIVKGAPFVIWEWEDLYPSEYNAILTRLGMSTTDLTEVSALATIRTKIERNASTYANYNATVIHRREPEDAVFSDGLYRSVLFRFEGLVAT